MLSLEYTHAPKPGVGNRSACRAFAALLRGPRIHQCSKPEDRGKYINWLTISGQAASVLEDVQRIRGNSMVPGDIPIYGYIYDCETGKLIEVPEATVAGRAV